MTKKASFKIETYEIGNVKILIEPAKVRIKNAYIEVSFSIGTAIYQTYTDFVAKSKNGDELSQNALKTLSDVLLTINMYHADIDFINHLEPYFKQKLGSVSDGKTICDGEVK